MTRPHLVRVLPFVAFVACSTPTGGALDPTPPPAEATSATPPVEGARARDLGVPFDGTPGPLNAITDVPGVRVGHTTIITGEGAHAVRTGVTAIRPRTDNAPVLAGTATFNGDGEMTGTQFIREFGVLGSPVMLTGTGNVGIVHTAVLRWSIPEDSSWPVFLPVVAETLDLWLSDYREFGLREEHAVAALEGAKGGAVSEGNVGGGTGMVCHQFKGGIGTSSRVVSEGGRYTVGVLVQCNYGNRDELRIAGVPVGRAIRDLRPRAGDQVPGDGSIIVVLATDAPLLPRQLDALCRRAALALGRMGTTGYPGSGDIFLAFSTQKSPRSTRRRPAQIDAISPHATARFNAAAVQAVEEAIVNALVAARTMTGKNGITVHALPHDRLRDILRQHGRLIEAQ